MDLTVFAAQASAVDGKVVARTAGDTRVTVVVRCEGASASRVSVRVGRFGDDVMQSALLERIRQNLKGAQSASAAG